MKDVYISTTESIVKFLSHKDPHIRNTAALLFPVLAKYDFDTFVKRFMHPVMNRLLEMLQTLPEKNPSMISNGLDRAAALLTYNC